MDNLLSIFSQFGLPGLVILGLAYGILFLFKQGQAERALWHEERKIHVEQIQKYLQTSIEIIQANTKAMTELTLMLQKTRSDFIRGEKASEHKD